MTDREIEKAVQCCGCPDSDSCKACPMDEKIKDDCRCGAYLALNTLAYITRLKAEKSALAKEADDNAALAMRQKLRADKLEETVANARKETAKEIYALMVGEFEPVYRRRYRKGNRGEVRRFGIMKNYSIKSIRKEFKEKGVFYTQPELAQYIKNLLPPDVDCVYDPTCGNGGLLSVFDDDVEKYGQDINQEQIEIAKERLKNFHGIAGDTLKNPAFKERKFDYIVGNPPFSIKWEPFEDERFCAPVLPPPSKADYAFILHILHYLSDEGKAVVLNFPGILYRGNREGQIRKWIIEKNYIEQVIHIAGGKFEDTSIATAIIVFNKAKTNTDILFVDDETNRSKIVSFDEIKGNNFNLSVQNYLPIETKKEEVDLKEMQLVSRKVFLETLRSELAFDKTVCELDGFDFQLFLNEIKEVLNQYSKDTESNP